MNSSAPGYAILGHEDDEYPCRINADGEDVPCPRCGAAKPYRLASGRYRCPNCRYTFSAFSGRWLGECRLGGREWLQVVALFEAERPLNEIAHTIGRAHATAFHAITVLRASIVAHSANCASLLHDTSATLRKVCAHRGHKRFRVYGHVPVFGLRDDGDRVTAPALPDVSPQRVLSLPVKKIRRGHLVYTGQVMLYDTLMFCVADEDIVARVPFSRSPAYIDHHSRFWAYAQPRFAMHHGVSADHFPLYLKELEFRYNHRHEALAPILLRYLCDFVQRPTP